MMFNKRNWLMLALCLVLMAGLMLPGVPAACAESSGTCGAEGDSLRWSLDRNRVLTISGTGAMADYVSSVDEGEHAPWGRDIRGVKIETGVTHVGDWAFCDCCSLTEATLPEGLESIGEYAFLRCASMTAITLPEDLESIGDYSFCRCLSLTSVNLPESLKSLGEGAFFNCEDLREVMLPETLESLEDLAFYNCGSLTAITLPEGLKSIGYGAFEGCPALRLTVPRDSYAAAYCERNGLNYLYPDSLDWLNG